MSFLVTNGVRTHYQRLPPKNPHCSPAPRVVFVHGLGYDSLASFYLTLAPATAAAGFDVLTYDLRGHGRSDRPASGYRLPDFCADLRELLDGLGIGEPVHLVGNSFGGTIAFAFAEMWQERVASIVAIEAEPATPLWSEKMARALSSVVDGMEAEEYLAWVEDNFGHHHARLAAAAAKVIRATSIVEDVPSEPLHDEAALANLLVPVLSIVGSEGFQSEDVGGLERMLPRCETVVVEGQGHSVLVERHHDIRPVILDWFSRVHFQARAVR